MQTCSNCGQENPDGFRLCGMCGAALAAAAPAAREERKVVTVLFTDLVGSTAAAEQLDPEDVRKILSPYYARLRAEIERHGGTVEKFIGDAVMAVFGAPAAHEDDPERAVRAALAIRHALADGELQIRTAVNTGEALVALLDDDALRADLRARAKPRAARFSWDRAADDTLAVYRSLTEVLAGRRYHAPLSPHRGLAARSGESSWHVASHCPG